MKIKLALAVFLGLSVLLFLVAASSRSSNDVDDQKKRAMLVVRDIGHKLLLHGGDSTSRVLPVREVGDGIFQLEFQSSFSFMPDSLVEIVQRNLMSKDLPSTYMVNVFECHSKDIVYGFQISPLKNNIVPCRGRVQPTRCYTIQLSFEDFSKARSADHTFYFYFAALISLCMVAFIGGSYWKKEKTSQPVPNQVFSQVDEENSIKLGKYFFSVDHQQLKNSDETIALSDKESKILAILATQQNQLINRDQLLKEVWEDDGVFTGRSLDMFISKLRKKLKGDPSIQIVNVHGKGYKLEIIND